MMPPGSTFVHSPSLVCDARLTKHLRLQVTTSLHVGAQTQQPVFVSDALDVGTNTKYFRPLCLQFQPNPCKRRYLHRLDYNKTCSTTPQQRILSIDICGTPRTSITKHSVVASSRRHYNHFSPLAYVRLPGSHTSSYQL